MYQKSIVRKNNVRISVSSTYRRPANLVKIGCFEVTGRCYRKRSIVPRESNFRERGEAPLLRQYRPSSGAEQARLISNATSRVPYTSGLKANLRFTRFALRSAFLMRLRASSSRVAHQNNFPTRLSHLPFLLLIHF